MRNNYLSLINFKVKLQRLFFIYEHNVGGSNVFFNVVNMVPHEVLECHVGCCNHHATLGI